MGVYQRRFYELLMLYHTGFTVKEVVKLFGYKRQVAYRWHSIYIKARQRALEVIKRKNSGILK
jgi:hypothetical protein